MANTVEPAGQDVEEEAADELSNLPFDEWTSKFGSERLTCAPLDRLTHHVNILEMNGKSYRLASSRKRQKQIKSDRGEEVVMT